MSLQNLKIWWFLGMAALCVGGSFAFADIASFEEIWFDEAAILQGQRVSFVLHYPESSPANESIPLSLEIMTTVPYQDTRIIIALEDGDENVVSESVQVMELRRGRNDVAMQWDPTGLAPGAYLMLVTVDYAVDFTPARHVIPVQRVSAAHWAGEIARLQGHLPQLDAGIASLAAEQKGLGTTGSANALHAPYLQIRKKIVEDALARAERALAERQWRLVQRTLGYASEALDIIRAEITFSPTMPESLAPHDAYPAYIAIRDGGLYENDQPLFLIGAAMQCKTAPESMADTAPSHLLYPWGSGETGSLADQLAWLKSHGLNFAVLNVPAGMGTAAFQEHLEVLAGAADTLKMPWVLQLDQENIVGPMMDAWPELLEKRFVNMAHDAFFQTYKQTARDMASRAGARHYLPIGLSIASNPQFKYDGESIHEQFVQRIRERYPDRIDLNRLWRAHLADYDEITIWGDHPDHSYQNQRAYQYEWQQFHRGLITSEFSSLKQELAAAAPNVPAMLTLPDSAFTPGETRHTPSREDMATLMDMNACEAQFTVGDGLYAMNYPDPHSYITLMRSYAPRKPVLILEADIDVSGAESALHREALVHSAVWEAVMSGATGMALSTDASVFHYPEALGAYAHAAMDVNRLAKIIMAFHQTPAQIGILFSEASKIMDDGVPHLESARYAFEGASFAGFPIRFLTEREIERGGLDGIKVLILPNTLAVPDETFEHLSKYVEEGRMVARVGTPIPYNERGHSRSDVIRATSNTVLVRGMNLPTEYLHAMDAALVGGDLPEIARPVNAFGYPIEGVRSRFVTHDGEAYLYVINLRKDPVTVHLTGLANAGRDLIRGRDITFPRQMLPLDPMLIHLDKKEMIFSVLD